NLRGLVGQLGDVDLVDRVADLAPARGPCGAGDDDLVEAESLGFHREIDLDRLTARDLHLLGYGCQAEADRVDLIASRRDVQDEISAVLAAEGAELLAL